jgi:hypothetical protein
MTESLFLTDLTWTASLGQERHCRYQQRFPQSAAFNVPIGATFTGDVDPAALEAALRAVTARHDPLRSSFVWGSSGLRARPQPPEAVPVYHHDVCDRASDHERAEVLAAIGAAEAARPFALESEPPTRAHLVRLAADEVALVLNIHHAAFDAWSSPVLFRELSDQYWAVTSGQPPARPEPEYTYADYAMAQRKRLRLGGYDEQIGFWRDQLRDAAPPAQWPSDGVAPDAPWWAGDMAWASLPQELVDAAVAVGTPYAARTDRRWHELIGFFANTLVMESVYEPDLTVREWVRRTHDQATRGHRNQEVPYGVLVDLLDPPVDPDRTPYFQTMFIVQNTPLPDPSFGPLRLRTTKIVTGSARYDITFCLGWRRGRLALELETRPALISQEAALRLAGTFFGLLAASVSDPDHRIGQLAPLPVEIGVRRGRERRPGIDGLFEGLVGDWRAMREG